MSSLTSKVIRTISASATFSFRRCTSQCVELIMATIQIVVFVLNFFIAYGFNRSCADYYWRDYYGSLPEDAVPAGNDSNGHPRYIGQVYIRGFELLTATIYPDKKLAITTAYANTYEVSDYVKILCSPHKEAFKWISIHSKDLARIKTEHILVDGGSEVGEKLWVGRIFGDDGVVVGKVFRDGRSNRGIWTPPHQNSLTYDVLSYDCEAVIQIDPRNELEVIFNKK